MLTLFPVFTRAAIFSHSASPIHSSYDHHSEPCSGKPLLRTWHHSFRSLGHTVGWPRETRSRKVFLSYCTAVEWLQVLHTLDTPLLALLPCLCCPSTNTTCCHYLHATHPPGHVFKKLWQRVRGEDPRLNATRGGGVREQQQQLNILHVPHYKKRDGTCSQR